ncbi:MAG: hypothetical protein Q9164_007894, partial [Protoblastenia rupestris]
RQPQRQFFEDFPTTAMRRSHGDLRHMDQDAHQYTAQLQRIQQDAHAQQQRELLLRRQDPEEVLRREQVLLREREMERGREARYEIYYPPSRR